MADSGVDWAAHSNGDKPEEQAETRVLPDPEEEGVRTAIETAKAVYQRAKEEYDLDDRDILSTFRNVDDLDGNTLRAVQLLEGRNVSDPKSDRDVRSYIEEVLEDYGEVRETDVEKYIREVMEITNRQEVASIAVQKRPPMGKGTREMLRKLADEAVERGHDVENLGMPHYRLPLDEDVLEEVDQREIGSLYSQGYIGMWPNRRGVGYTERDVFIKEDYFEIEYGIIEGMKR